VCRLGPETPYTLLTRIGARVSSASALLLAADGSRVLRGGLVSAAGLMWAGQLHRGKQLLLAAADGVAK